MRCEDCLREDGGHEKGCPLTPNAPKNYQTMFQVGYIDHCKGSGPNSDNPSYRLGWSRASEGVPCSPGLDLLSFGIL